MVANSASATARSQLRAVGPYDHGRLLSEAWHIGPSGHEAIATNFAVQDDIFGTCAIEPSLRQAEIERVKRKRPDSLDAYD